MTFFHANPSVSHNNCDFFLIRAGTKLKITSDKYGRTLEREPIFTELYQLHTHASLGHMGVVCMMATGDNLWIGFADGSIGVYEIDVS